MFHRTDTIPEMRINWGLLGAIVGALLWCLGS